MSNTGRLDCVSCHQVFKHWLEFQLIDNQGKPLGGIPYTLKSWDGIVKANGVTDGQGVLREEDLPPKPMILHVDAQKLAEQLIEKSPAEAVATAKGTGAYHQLVPGEISNATPEVEGWTQEALLASRYYPDPSYPGFIARPSHNRRHVLEIARIAKPVFAKSCLQPPGCTDAGTDMEPHSNFGQMQIYHTVPNPNGIGTANQGKKNDSEPLIFQALAWVGNQVFGRAEAHPLIEVAMVAGQQTNAVIVGSAAAKAANQGNDEQNKGSQPLLSKNERQTLEGIQSSLTRDYQLASASAMALGMMLRNWVNGDADDLYSHEHLKKIADKKGTAETRVRYRFVENAETGQLTAVGYHTAENAGMEKVKVRHVQYNKSLNRYEFWEDGASSPTLVWYRNATSGGLSQQDIDKSVPQDATVNVKVAVLDPQATGQTPGLPIPEEKDWRDGAYVNPQQDPNEIGGNSTSTPIPDARDNGPTKLTTPAPEEKDFRDYILIFPVADIPPIYVYLNKSNDTVIEYVNPRVLISIQNRNEMSGSQIKRYVKDMKKNGYDIEYPVEVANVNGKMIIIDGHHRAESAVKAGLNKIPVRVINVTDEQGDNLLIQAAEARVRY
ncbi:S-type pyocin domain-containing protein [Xenorhabdus santafensis]|nr:S-type pyocin domain-containing protein [Xenorhabdus sp. 12]